MEVVSLAEGIGEAVIRAAGILRKGGVIVYPTDTLYGLGVDAFSDEAVAKMHDIKGREPGKPTHCVVADLVMAEEYAEINDATRKLAEKFLPGGLTLVLKKKPGVNGGIAHGMDTIGIRIPDDEFCIELARAFGRPYTATSANLAGMVPERSVEKILEQLSGKAASIDLAVDAGLLPERAPSTVVTVVSGHPSVLREGAISSKAILEA
jgi:L-threonylcarbamoyladenylate synthase